MSATASLDRTLTQLIARLARVESPYADAEAAFVRWALENQDPWSGRWPSPERNPHRRSIPEARVQACDHAIRRWLTFRDGQLWENLATVLRRCAPPATRDVQLELLAACREVRGRTARDRRAIRAYLRVWPTASRVELRRTLSEIAALAEACEYMSTYKPKGLIALPPFAVGADAVLESVGGRRPSSFA